MSWRDRLLGQRVEGIDDDGGRPSQEMSARATSDYQIGEPPRNLIGKTDRSERRYITHEFEATKFESIHEALPVFESDEVKPWTGNYREPGSITYRQE